MLWSGWWRNVSVEQAVFAQEMAGGVLLKLYIVVGSTHWGEKGTRLVDLVVQFLPLDVHCIM